MSDKSHKANGDLEDAGQKESSSLKRGRETSLEPSAPESSSAQATALKKNRLEQARSATRTSPIPESEDAPSASSLASKTTIGEVRRKVEKMSHAEGESGVGEVVDVEAAETGEHSGGKEKDLKRKALERSDSSFVGNEAEAKRPKDTPSPPLSEPKLAATAPEGDTDPASIPAPAPKKPQATFGAFSSSASPFARSSLASGSTSTPSALGSTSASKTFSSSGFGGFSGSSSPFAAKKTSIFGSTPTPSSTALTPSSLKSTRVPDGENEAEGEKEKVDDVDEAGQGKQENFGDILSGVGEDEEVKDKPQMTEKDVVTGEEDESTKFQMRTKLYVMQSDNSWRERGVGVLRLNVRRGDGHGARLVMRAEGVLRLILNVSLYVGQTCLEDGKHVRTTVFEDGERRFVTFRTGSVKAAQELAGHIQEYIPLGSTKTPSKSPQPSSVPGEKVSDERPSGR